ncbi:MAG: glycosyltransferase family 2 protein [Lautropia sp.]
MSDSPRFSVVVPLYNKAPYVRAALASALADRVHVREVIVVDDGSTDDGAAIVAGIADSRVRLVRQANGGVSRARNRGIALARFKWIAFLDADDYWRPGYVATLADLANRFPDCAMLGTFYDVVDDQGTRWAPKGRWDLGADAVRIDDFHGAMARGHLCFTGSIALSRSLIVSHGLRFPEGEHLGEDLDMFFLAAEHTSMAFSPQPLAVYRDAAQVGRLSHGRLDDLVPPFIRRMEGRYVGGEIPPAKRAGVEQYLATHYEHLVLRAIDDGRRRPVLPLLLHPLLRARMARWCGLVAFYLMPVRWGARIREWRKVVA